MPDLDLSGLDKLVKDSAANEPKIIEPVAGLPNLRLLAVDQSIANSGWAVMIGAGVIWTGNVKTSALSKGHEDTLLRGEELLAEFSALIQQYTPHLIVHEYPPLGGPRMMRPESSMVAAMALRAAARMHSVQVEMVAAQKVKKRLTGNGNAKKQEVKRAILALDPSLATMKPFNEAICDAIGLGWVASERMGR